MWEEDQPMLKLEISEGANLQLLEENISPFLLVTSGDQSFKTKVASLVQDRYVFNEKSTIPLDPKSALFICLYTFHENEEFLLDKISVPFNDIAVLKKPSSNWVSFHSNKKAVAPAFSLAGILTTGIKRETGKSPQVYLTFTFIPNHYLRIVEAKVLSCKIILKPTVSYTEYAVEVVRNDEKKWVKAVRYSQVAALKSELEDVDLGLGAIELPGKTYFEFLACVFPTLGRFHPKVIESRRKGIQDVLTYLIGRYRNIGEDTLNNLLE